MPLIDSDGDRSDAPIVDIRQGGDRRPYTQYPSAQYRTIPMHELHCHRHGHSADVHVSSSRLHPGHRSVKPGISWHVGSSTFMNTYRTTGFTKTGQRPRGANS